ncbi:uncharacterized protein LAJ45_09043 [Morchella importuna]|uniref:uncharacterized protein n=1 Tax=Morchella importuna TaxID=1174673 RepID=UPI001E8CA17D|nr:uncharacterized protein LAJ45_09043 [Morchella importuna]KAH8146962.1 hypothetical protein LAJ45_09043 [Morchella importuna]
MASLTSIAPGYGFGSPHSQQGAMIRGGQSVIEEPVVEHEHHHVHHHIDHGNVNVAAQVAVRPRAVQREYSYDDLYDRDRRYGSGASLGSLGRVGINSRFARSDIDLNLDSSFRTGRRGSVYDERESEYAIIDVPAGTRRVTVDMAREREQEAPSWRRDNGVRRSRGLGNELWTEITKDLVTREAIEDCGYQYEETEFFYYIFEYLHRDQIAELTDLTTDIRRQRVRDIEYESIAGRERDRERERRTLDWDREDSRTEIIIESGRSNANAGGRRRRYYY